LLYQIDEVKKGMYQEVDGMVQARMGEISHGAFDLCQQAERHSRSQLATDLDLALDLIGTRNPSGVTLKGRALWSVVGADGMFTATA